MLNYRNRLNYSVPWIAEQDTLNAEHCAPAATWNEAERLIALARYTALDALCITELEALAAMAADLCACPAAAIHFVDDQYQHCMAAFALEREAVVRERSPSAWAIRQEGALVLPISIPSPSSNCRGWPTARPPVSTPR